MDHILDITQKAQYDERIVKLETHTHLPYASSKFGPSDEIRIPFQQVDTYVWPSGSSLLIEGTLTGHTDYTLTNNAGAFAFDEIRLDLNGVQADAIKSPGISSTLKGYVSFSKEMAKRLQSAGWRTKEEANTTVDPKSGHFEMCIPLKTLLGFMEDYSRIMINTRMELILIRSNKDNNMLVPLNKTKTSAVTPSVKIEKISWKLPYISLSDREKLKMMTVLERNIPLEMPFRQWSLYTYPTLPQTSMHSWTIKTSTQMEKPRFVILALQTGRSGEIMEDASQFDSCHLKNLKLYIGSNVYPYDNLNLNFDNRSLTWLYEMYVNFQHSYYGKEDASPMLSYEDFIKVAPIVVIDCSRQVESISSSTMDVRVEFETKENVPSSTSAFCLIIHDQLLTHYPLSNIITKGI